MEEENPPEFIKESNDHRVTGSPSYVIVDRKNYTGRVYRVYRETDKQYSIIQRQTDKRYKESGTEMETR